MPINANEHQSRTEKFGEGSGNGSADPVPVKKVKIHLNQSLSRDLTNFRTDLTVILG